MRPTILSLALVALLGAPAASALAQQHAHTAPTASTTHVNTIIVNCKLPPNADEALHHIIGPLLQDASALKADPQRLDAIAGVRKALDQYAQQFDDPGFPESAAD